MLILLERSFKISLLHFNIFCIGYLRWGQSLTGLFSIFFGFRYIFFDEGTFTFETGQSLSIECDQRKCKIYCTACLFYFLYAEVISLFFFLIHSHVFLSLYKILRLHKGKITTWKQWYANIRTRVHPIMHSTLLIMHIFFNLIVSLSHASKRQKKIRFQNVFVLMRIFLI